MSVYSQSSNPTFQAIIEGSQNPDSLSASEFWIMWQAISEVEKDYLIAIMASGGSGGPPVAPGARTTTARTTGTTITAGFTRATVTWLGGGTGTLTVDGIPWDMATAGSVEYGPDESGSDVVITLSNSDTYYTTVVA